MRSRVRYERTGRQINPKILVTEVPAARAIRLLMGRGTINVPMTLIHAASRMSNPAEKAIQRSAGGMA